MSGDAPAAGRPPSDSGPVWNRAALAVALAEQARVRTENHHGLIVQTDGRARAHHAERDAAREMLTLRLPASVTARQVSIVIAAADSWLALLSMREPASNP